MAAWTHPRPGMDSPVAVWTHPRWRGLARGGAGYLLAQWRAADKSC